MLLAKSSETLPLSHSVDIRSDDEGDDVEEGYPELIWEEFLRKGQADWRRDPRHAHDSPKADLDGRSHLVVCASTGNEGHGDQVDAVLNRRNLSKNKR